MPGWPRVVAPGGRRTTTPGHSVRSSGPSGRDVTDDGRGRVRVHSGRSGSVRPVATAGTSRRTALRTAAGAALWLLSGCSTGDGVPSASRRSQSPPAEAGDEALLEDVRRTMSALLGLTTATAGLRERGTRPLADPLDPVVSRLSARLDAVGASADPAAGPGASPPSDSARAVRQLQAATSQHADVTRTAASDARSGDLARLLAAVAAGLGQDAAVLARLPQAGGNASSSDRAAADPDGAGLAADLEAHPGDTATVEPAQQVLAGEHAAMYAYGVVGGRRVSNAPEAGRAARAYVVHRARRDALTAALRAAGADPVPAAATYELPVAVTSAATARRVGQQVEDRCSVLYALLVAVTPAERDGVRAQAAVALSDAGLRLLDWGGAATALPGVQRP